MRLVVDAATDDTQCFPQSWPAPLSQTEAPCFRVYVVPPVCHRLYPRRDVPGFCVYLENCQTVLNTGDLSVKWSF